MTINGAFTDEMDFENTVIQELTKYKWDKKILEYPSEQDLIQNWANILFANNRAALRGYPLTDTEMRQIINQVDACRSTRDVNRLINGRTICITRDNPNDKINLNQIVALKIYDRMEIAAGKSVYQIAKEPKIKTSDEYHNKRADVMLLINGMPVIHIEFKRAGGNVFKAVGQIEQYKYFGVFSGIFKLIQIFVAMTPEETLYFANNELDKNGRLNRNNCFHWEDFNNDIINDWQQIIRQLLSIPMAHELIGFYTIPDESDRTLKVMRSYQCWATKKVVDAVFEHNQWNKANNKGGYVWHTTGSGKTLTSFKCAQLISFYNAADKVIFLVDRTELGTQSFKDYKNFANDTIIVNKTENTTELRDLLKSRYKSERLIVTSIQKMSRIQNSRNANNEEDVYIDAENLKKINQKKIVVIVDECHRSVFGEMLRHIQETFPNALYFGFTGTPIYLENAKEGEEFKTTKYIFGNELHRYTIADGMRDGNVLGFDPYEVMTFDRKELRKAVALHEAKAKNENEAFANPKKKKVYMQIMDENQTPMAGYFDNHGRYHKGLEDYIPTSQYETEEHRKAVVDNIIENWRYTSNDSKFHALFATSSIKEAIEYYKLFQDNELGLKVFALFDPNIDYNNNDYVLKTETMLEILKKYNETYGTKYSRETDWASYKVDISLRLAHKDPYSYIDRDKNQQIDILIVVDQMLTGFDSKWINTIYLDKVLEDEHIVQTFSRTNRIYNPKEEKQFGTIKYYRKPYTMKENIKKAFAIYSGERSLEVFVPKIEENIIEANKLYGEIIQIFESESIQNLSTFPKEETNMKQFANKVKQLVSRIDSAIVQGFDWEEEINRDKNNVAFSQSEFETILTRYREMMDFLRRESNTKAAEPPFDVNTYVYELKDENINAELLNRKFDQYKKVLPDGNSEEVDKLRQELSNSFDSLPAEDQRFAKIVIDKLDSGDLDIKNEKTFYEYIYELKRQSIDENIAKCAIGLGIDAEILSYLAKSNLDERNLDEGGKFTQLMNSIDPIHAQPFLENYYKISYSALSDVMADADKFLRDFILNKDIKL